MSVQSPTEVAEALHGLEPGFLPFPIFTEVARLVVTPCLELVCFRVGPDGTIQVLLTKRGADDPNWPNQLHSPGTVIRATDVNDDGTFSSAIGRIVRQELGDMELRTAPKLVTHLFHHVKRGVEIGFVHWVVVGSAPDHCEFYDVTALPDNLIEHHYKVIATALSGYSAEFSEADLLPRMFDN